MATAAKHSGKGYLLVGLLLVLFVSLVQGFDLFFKMFAHIAEDLGPGLAIHAYLFGWALLLSGGLRMARRRWKFRKEGNGSFRRLITLRSSHDDS